MVTLYPAHFNPIQGDLPKTFASCQHDAPCGVHRDTGKKTLRILKEGSTTFLNRGNIE